MKAFGTVVRTGAGKPVAFVIVSSVVGLAACSLPGTTDSGAGNGSGSDAGAGSTSGEGNDASGFPRETGKSNDAGGQTPTNDAGNGFPAAGDAGGPDAAGQNNGPDAAGQNNGPDAT